MTRRSAGRTLEASLTLSCLLIAGCSTAVHPTECPRFRGKIVKTEVIADCDIPLSSAQGGHFRIVVAATHPPELEGKSIRIEPVPIWLKPEAGQMSSFPVGSEHEFPKALAPFKPFSLGSCD